LNRPFGTTLVAATDTSGTAARHGAGGADPLEIGAGRRDVSSMERWHLTDMNANGLRQSHVITPPLE
jgi:hypothetical protein